MKKNLGFKSQFKSIVVAGDEGQKMFFHGIDRTWVGTLGTDYNASVFGIPIIEQDYDGNLNDHDLVNYYKGSIATPKGLTYMGEGYPIKVGPGSVFPALGFEDFIRPVTAALENALF